MFSLFETDTGYAKFGKVTGGADEAIEDSAVQADSGNYKLGHGSF